jgi:bile acid-coenzyme A ligase
MAIVALGDVPDINAGRFGAHAWCIRHGEEVLDWSTLAERSLRRAHALAASGVGQDDFVVLALPNHNCLYELTFALWKLGATPMVVSSRLPLAELRAVLKLAEPSAVIVHDPVLTVAVGAQPSSFGIDHPDATTLKSRIAKHWKAMTSGGSTGRPKIIVDHHSSEFDASSPPLQLPSGGTMLNPAPIYHNFPFAMTHVALVFGTRVVGMTKFEPAELLDLVERYRVEWVNLVPTMMNRIARLPKDVRARYDVSSLKTVWHTAAPIPHWLKQAWIDWLGPERIWEMYGGTEGYCTTALNGDEWLKHRGSVGRPTFGEIFIRGEDGRALPPGQVGEIFMRPLGQTAHSYHYIGAQSQRLSDGFDSLGDFGWVDEDGYLYIADRRSDLILCGGSNIYPAEVEAALMEHPAVETAIVVGLPDEDLGAVPHAILHLEPNAVAPSEDELRSFVAERLVLYKTPRSYEFTNETLRDEAGKVRRARLRAERLATPSANLRREPAIR